MISKNLVKFIRQLESKKGRLLHNFYVAEGPKVVGDLMEVTTPLRVFAVKEWWETQERLPCSNDIIVTYEELQRLSLLQHPQQVIALFPLPQNEHPSQFEGLILALYGVQDPGNLGTIIRLADWFGINTIVCSYGTADAWNPKVVQATMGSLAHVVISYTDLPAFLSSLSADTPIYGTFLDGENIYNQTLTTHGVIVMGNEGSGISPNVSQHINCKLFIPSFACGCHSAESLNVAIATAITCSEFRRRGKG